MTAYLEVFTRNGPAMLKVPNDVYGAIEFGTDGQPRTRVNPETGAREDWSSEKGERI